MNIFEDPITGERLTVYELLDAYQKWAAHVDLPAMLDSAVAGDRFRFSGQIYRCLGRQPLTEELPED